MSLRRYLFLGAGAGAAPQTTAGLGAMGFGLGPIGMPLVFGSAVTVTLQYLRPASDVSNTGWTPTSGTNASVLDEAVFDDLDYTQAIAAGSEFVVALTAGTTPPSNADLALSVRVPVGFSPNGALTVKLEQGAAVKATWTISTPAAGTTYDLTLTQGEFDSITNWADLRVRVRLA